mmetsp:Transcript_24474/g.40963  ORF Transcript_24474/g.40963 Transcript_24474/m.40963 type:complete len:223 (-) Transcript_24474:274-942(-)
MKFAYAVTQWPQSPPSLRPALEGYYVEMQRLAACLMSLMAIALCLPPSFFAPLIDRHISALRCVNYPELNGAPAPGKLRAGAHSDYGSITTLLGEDRPGVLEICTAATNNEWQRVPAVDGAFIVNVGDLMARWTNDRWLSTLHRVGLPNLDPYHDHHQFEKTVDGEKMLTRRQSLVFFHQLNWDARIECIGSTCGERSESKYPPTTSGRYLMSKFHSTVQGN